MSRSLTSNLTVKYNNFTRIHFVAWWATNKLNEESREAERYTSAPIELCDDRIICPMRPKDVHCSHSSHGVPTIPL